MNISKDEDGFVFSCKCEFKL